MSFGLGPSIGSKRVHGTIHRAADEQNLEGSTYFPDKRVFMISGAALVALESRIFPSAAPVFWALMLAGCGRRSPLSSNDGDDRAIVRWRRRLSARRLLSPPIADDVGFSACRL